MYTSACMRACTSACSQACLFTCTYVHMHVCMPVCLWKSVGDVCTSACIRFVVASISLFILTYCLYMQERTWSRTCLQVGIRVDLLRRLSCPVQGAASSKLIWSKMPYLSTCSKGMIRSLRSCGVNFLVYQLQAYPAVLPGEL